MRHRHRGNLFGLAGSCHGGGAGAPHAKVLEGPAIVAAGRVHAGREGRVLVDLSVDRQPVVDPHQRVRVRIGQGLKQDPVHDAEDRGIRTDTERQREHDRQNESGMGADQAHVLSCGAQRVFGERDGVHSVNPIQGEPAVPVLAP